MMIRQLSRTDRGNALILDAAILELLGLEADGEVQLTISNGSLIVTPVNPRQPNSQRFEAALEQVVTQRRDVLRQLAK